MSRRQPNFDLNAPGHLRMVRDIHGNISIPAQDVVMAFEWFLAKDGMTAENLTTAIAVITQEMQKLRTK